ncbi:hypothetical protein VNI00_015803 [Paramarasmius palmivorus]|uniref:Receptor ligand binding region domain-containing protein n=1 Tax=Paramarasmius palmivorus TaxID=297713 RepID=A0AAW0BI64_9AGAR
MPKRDIKSWNAGYIIEGLAILLSIQSNDMYKDRHVVIQIFLHRAGAYSPTLDRVTRSVLAATKYPRWNNVQGILNINDDGKVGASSLIRGLSNVLANKESYGSDVSDYVEGYLGNQVEVSVSINFFWPILTQSRQYNAVLEQATRNGTNVYGYPWLGPPHSVANYSAEEQLKATSVLIAGIRLSSKPEKPPPLETPRSSRNTNSNAGVIVGGILGGLLFATLVIIGSLLIIRRRHERNSNRVSESVGDIQPFPVGFTTAERVCRESSSIAKP